MKCIGNTLGSKTLIDFETNITNNDENINFHK